MSKVSWKRGYHINGALEFELPVVADRIHGKVKRYHDNKVLQRETLYVNGLRYGVQKTYDTDGVLESKIYYVNDLPQHNITRLEILILFGEKTVVTVVL